MLRTLGSEFKDCLMANFTLRRIPFLLVGWGLMAVCAAVVLGLVNLELWQTVVALIGGLLLLEWAG